MPCLIISDLAAPQLYLEGSINAHVPTYLIQVVPGIPQSSGSSHSSVVPASHTTLISPPLSYSRGIYALIAPWSSEWQWHAVAGKERYTNEPVVVTGKLMMLVAGAPAGD